MFFKKYNKGKMVERVFKLLKDNNWKRVSAWDIVNKCKVLHYTEYIRQIRKSLNDTKEDWKYKILQNKNRLLKNKNWEIIKETFYKLDL